MTNLGPLAYEASALTELSISDTCKPGFVWREAFSNDHVCVDPAVRAQAQADNAAAKS
jgi:hypothetical protein